MWERKRDGEHIQNEISENHREKLKFAQNLIVATDRFVSSSFSRWSHDLPNTNREFVFFLTYCFACMRTNNDCLFAVHFMLLLCILTFSVGFVCGKSIYTKKFFFRMQWMDVWKLDDIVEVCISKMYFSE